MYVRRLLLSGKNEDFGLNFHLRLFLLFHFYQGGDQAVRRLDTNAYLEVLIVSHVT
jgi:hypothetical protein